MNVISMRARWPRGRSAVAIMACGLAGIAAAAEPAASGPPATTPPAAGASDSVVMCGSCATVLSVRSETRVAGKGIGPAAGETLNAGVLGDEPSGRGINDTTTAPPGLTSNGLIVPKADRRMANSTVWKVAVQRRDGSTTVIDLPDDPVLRPGDLVTLDGGKLSRTR